MSVDPHFFFKLCKIELNIFISSLILNTFLLIGEHFDKRIKYISPYITWLIFFLWQVMLVFYSYVVVTYNFLLKYIYISRHQSN